MNLPADIIHDTLNANGVLICPWFGKDRWGKRKWLAFFEKKGVRKTDHNGFHNCRVTGIN